MSVINFSFEKLEVWQLAKRLTVSIHKCTASYPIDEKFGLISQTRRAAVSVCSNIAEGSCRITGKDQAHFTAIAYGSLMELGSHLLITNELGYIGTDELRCFKKAIQEIATKLTNLRFYQLNWKGRI